MKWNFLLFGILATASELANVVCEVVVNTEYGQVSGTTTEKAVQFLGIPYAKPPVGDLRWQSPQKPTPWSPNLFNATQNGPGCPQKNCPEFLPPHICPDQISEDCLYLNVWTPLDATNTSNYPVMAFIHGGGYTYGFMESSLYDGGNIVKSGQVVFVGIAYRLGVLGFLYTGDGDSNVQGNFGIQDQRLALEWIKDNIQQFGGNPDKVTVFGQSAGAQSIAVHLASRQSDNLFQRAIIQSSPFAVPFRSKKDAIALADVIVKPLKCSVDDLTCLRSKTVDEILDAQQDSLQKFTTSKLLEYVEPIGPVIDGKDVKYQLFEAAARGEVQPVSTILGSVTEEFRLFLYEALSTPMSRLEYRAAVAVVHPSHFLDIEFKYPPPSGNDDFRDALSQVLTDYLFTCASRNVSRSIVNNGNRNVYRYIFDHATQSRGSWGNFTFCEGHVCHSEELSYIFWNRPGKKETSEEMGLHQAMVSYWTNFAHTGNPNTGPNSVDITWPTDGPSSPSVMDFKTPTSKPLLQFRGDFCDFWDSVGYQI